MKMPESDMTIATWLIIATALVWIIVDVWLYLRKNKLSTISQVITGFSWYSPMVPFIVGLLAGHWFWGFALIVLIGDFFGNTIEWL